MKIIAVVFLVLMVLGGLADASPISQQWIKIYGGDDVDGFNCIQQTMDGGYIAAGHTRSFAPGGAIYLWVLKFDVNGNVSWQKTYHYGTWINDAYTIQQTRDGGYILGGFTSSPVKAWILKLDSIGEIVWQKIYDDMVQFSSIQQTADGGYIALGSRFAIEPNSNSNIIVLKLDGAGNIIWQRSYDISYLDDPWAIKQTTDGGYVVTGYCIVSGYDIFVLKINSIGDISWVKTYSGTYQASSIQQTSDGGYVLAGDSGSYAEVLKLDNSGNITWEKRYGGSSDNWAVAIHETTDGGYSMVGSTNAFGSGGYDVWVLKLNSHGDIIWQKTYGGDAGDWGIFFDKTLDGGYVVAGNTSSFGADGLMIIKLDANGEIPGCDIIRTSDAQVFNEIVAAQDISVAVESPNIIAITTDAIPQDCSVEISVVCYYENPIDIDGDGIENNPSGAMASSYYNGSFLTDVDNCSESPNGPYLGTCTKGNVGSTCISNEACGHEGICSMNQEDSFPPQGNGIGDACDCEGDFDCDGDCDGTDASAFKLDFGRSGFENPCEGGDTCNGDFDCDGDCDGTDAVGFKVDFGRSSFNDPCPACFVGEWCSYPLP